MVYRTSQEPFAVGEMRSVRMHIPKMDEEDQNQSNEEDEAPRPVRREPLTWAQIGSWDKPEGLGPPPPAPGWVPISTAAFSPHFQHLVAQQL